MRDGPVRRLGFRVQVQVLGGVWDCWGGRLRLSRRSRWSHRAAVATWIGGKPAMQRKNKNGGIAFLKAGLLFPK